MATPLVAGTLALMKIMAEKTPENVVGWNGISKEEWLRQLIATSGSITNGTSGELMGMWTNNAPTFEGGNSSIRVLNAQNALTIARWRGNNPWVRVFNSDNIGEMNAYSYVWGSPQWNYGNTNYTSTSLSEDVIYGMGGYVANDYVVAFRVNNTAGSYSHGYQLYRFGRIWNENIGGSSRREWPNATLIHDTIGEDAGNTTTGYRRAYQTNAL